MPEEPTSEVLDRARPIPLDDFADRDAVLLAAETRGRLALQLAGLASQLDGLASQLDRIEANQARLAPLLELFEQAEGLSLPQVFKLLTQPKG